MTAASSELHRYLDALYARVPLGSYVEVRWRTRQGMARIFIPAHELHRVERAITERADSTDVYVGVIPRARRRGGRADLVHDGVVVWVDCDTLASTELVHRFALPPTLMVRSGSAANRHAYWFLTDPQPIAALELANRSLATALHADQGSSDAARILRPPGSRNHKRGRKTRVDLERCQPKLTYQFTDIREAAGAETPLSPVLRGRTARLTDDPLLAIPPATYVERLAGLTVPRNRKVRCPFHDDRIPSLHVYPEASGGWYCFGCHRGGSLYDFAAALWGAGTRGAAFFELAGQLRGLFGPEDLAGEGGAQ